MSDKENVAITKTNGFKIFLQPCTQVSIFLLHFIAKIKLMLYFYFQIPKQTNPDKHQPYNKRLILQSETITRPQYAGKNPQAFRATTKKKSVLPFDSRQKTENENMHHTSVPQPQQVLDRSHLLKATHTVQ